MTCEQARSLLKGAWTASAGLAFTWHFLECPACQEFVKGLAANFPEAERKEMADKFQDELLPQMTRALLTDPEVKS